MYIDDLIYDVVNTVRKFELGFTSVKRNPIDYQIRVGSMEEFIECRLNFEAFKYDALNRAAELLDGHLFKVTRIEGLHGNRFNRAIIELATECPSNIDMEDWEIIMDDVRYFIGGGSLSFSSNRNNMNIVILDPYGKEEIDEGDESSLCDDIQEQCPLPID